MKRIIYILLTVLAFNSCVNKDEESIGEQVVHAPDGFVVTGGTISFSADNPDFNSNPVNLVATFNAEVTANIVFKGLTSGAIRRMTVTSDKLDASNTEWWGEFHPGSGLWFKSGEQVEVSVSFYNHETVYKDIITINKENLFKNHADMRFVDLELENGFEDGTNIGGAGGWWYDTNTDLHPDGEAVARRILDIGVQGDYYHQLEGVAPVGGVYIGGSAYGVRAGTLPDGNEFYDLPSDADQVWFNFFVYGDGNEATELYVEFKESDEFKSNGSSPDDIAQDGRDDGVLFKQTFEHSGWKLVSIRYSAMSFSNYAPGGGSGSKVMEPHRIKLVTFSLQSLNKELVSAKIDYPMFTIGQPFDPIVFRK